MRGEYVDSKPDKPADLELPPRARRIHGVEHAGASDDGTTSACAENTFESFGHKIVHGNYLRVRGEYYPRA